MILLLIAFFFSLLLIHTSLAKISLILDPHDSTWSALWLATEAKFCILQIEFRWTSLAERIFQLSVTISFASNTESIPRVYWLSTICALLTLTRIGLSSLLPQFGLSFHFLFLFSLSKSLYLVKYVEVLVGAHLTARVVYVSPIFHRVYVSAGFAAPLALVKRNFFFRCDVCSSLFIIIKICQTWLRISRIIGFVESILRPYVFCSLSRYFLIWLLLRLCGSLASLAIRCTWRLSWCLSWCLSWFLSCRLIWYLTWRLSWRLSRSLSWFRSRCLCLSRCITLCLSGLFYLVLGEFSWRMFVCWLNFDLHKDFWEVITWVIVNLQFTIIARLVHLINSIALPTAPMSFKPLSIVLFCSWLIMVSRIRRRRDNIWLLLVRVWWRLLNWWAWCLQGLNDFRHFLSRANCLNGRELTAHRFEFV